MAISSEIELQAINTLRFLSADGVQKANSGHPGLPMGAAAVAYCVWTRFLNFNTSNPQWMNRDRFILSGGHGSMLLYSLLYLSGYDLSLDDLKNFRQWGSKTPGHPEYGITPGVEVTTGPLGQGFANGVGMAIAAKHLASLFNRPGYELINHQIYAIVTDGDLMEGVASEAASLAGHLQLGNIIYLYDDNHISIDGSTDLAFTEDRVARFKAYNWHVSIVENGNDVKEVKQAIEMAMKDPRPSLIAVKTIIGYGLPTRQGTSKAHGEPPGVAELEAAKRNLDWPVEPDFYVPGDVLEIYRAVGLKGRQLNLEWQALLGRYESEYPEEATEFKRLLRNELPTNWDDGLPFYQNNPKGTATRNISGEVINALAKNLPGLMGGSADLAPSNKTWIEGEPAFQANSPEGRNMHFGVRENAMGSIVNGMAVYGGIIPYGATFLVFSDYMRPAIRLSALSSYPSIWVFTHDSIGLGEDGPTHQPVEHLAALRAIPELCLIRPADANEVVEAWKIAISRRQGPTALALSRQNVPTLDRERFSSASEVSKGAYVLADLGSGEADIILMATGSEVGLIIKAGELLEQRGINVRLVSFPSWDLFAKQELTYQQSVFPSNITKRIAVEAGVELGWRKWIGEAGTFIGLDTFGHSAPYEILYEKMGITVDRIVQEAINLLN